MDGAQVEDRSQRGATLVQYALVVALIGLVVLTAVSKMGTGSKDTFHAAGTGVHTEGASGGAGGSGDTGGGSEGHPATTAATTPPPTTPATTAPPATTTTTKAPTTTTAPPTTTTTTTAAPKSASVAFTSTSAIADSSSLWHARTTVQVRGPSGEAVAGTSVELLVEGWSSTGGGGTRRTSQVVSVITAANGNVVLDTGTVARSGSSRVNSITIKVQDASVPSGFVWNGATPSASVDRI